MGHPIVKQLVSRQISWRSGRRRGLCGALGLTLLAVAGTASAQAPSSDHKNGDYNGWEITPFYGYMAGGEFEDPVSGGNRDLEEDNNFGIFVNAAVDPWRHYELLYSKQGSEIGGGSPFDLDVEYLQIGGTVMYQDAQRVFPYFGITVGGARFSPDAPGMSDETKFAFSVGGGFKVPVTDHFGVRFDVRGFVSLLDTDGNIFCVSDNGAGTCAIRTKSDTFFQYHAALGATFAF